MTPTRTPTDALQPVHPFPTCVGSSHVLEDSLRLVPAGCHQWGDGVHIIGASSTQGFLLQCSHLGKRRPPAYLPLLTHVRFSLCIIPSAPFPTSLWTTSASCHHCFRGGGSSLTGPPLPLCPATFYCCRARPPSPRRVQGPSARGSAEPTEAVCVACAPISAGRRAWRERPEPATTRTPHQAALQRAAPGIPAERCKACLFSGGRAGIWAAHRLLANAVSSCSWELPRPLV